MTKRKRSFSILAWPSRLLSYPKIVKGECNGSIKRLLSELPNSSLLTPNLYYMKILIINGPNLNLLGKREPGIYGNNSMESYLPELRKRFEGIEIEYYQSNIEGEMINKMQEVGFSYDGIVLNAGAYTHTSVALLDCIRSLTTPVIEVHISNVHAREEFRNHSMISAGCKGVIAGFGLDSYRLAVESIIEVRGKE